MKEKNSHSKMENLRKVIRVSGYIILGVAIFILFFLTYLNLTVAPSSGDSSTYLKGMVANDRSKEKDR